MTDESGRTVLTQFSATYEERGGGATLPTQGERRYLSTAFPGRDTPIAGSNSRLRFGVFYDALNSP